MLPENNYRQLEALEAKDILQKLTEKNEGDQHE